MGAQVTLVAGVAAFRAADVGKYVHLLGGIVRLTAVDSPTSVRGEILVALTSTDTNPGAVPAGAWTLEVASWSATHGFPRTGEFIQGRLGQAGTTGQPTTVWASASDGYDDYGVGTVADRAIDYTCLLYTSDAADE